MDDMATKALQAIAETGSFRRAAEALGVTQPYVSQVLRRLEEDYGALFVDRKSHPRRLTPAGEFFLESQRRMARIERKTREFCADWSGSQGGTLRLACNGERINGMLIPVISAFRKNRPEVALDLTLEMDLADIPSALLKGEADVGVLFEGLLAPGLDAVRLGCERYLLAVADAPENAGFGVPWNAAGRYPRLSETDLTPLRRLPMLPTLDHAERTALISKAVGIELSEMNWTVRQLGTRMALAAEGQCMAVCQENLVGAWGSSRRCRFASLEDVLPVQTVVAAFSAEEYRSDAAKEFCRIAASVLRPGRAE